MRSTQPFNAGWLFFKPGEVQQMVALPHTWNNGDGQDGGNDYYRGKCVYKKEFDKPTMAENEQAWLEFEGVAMTATVLLNGSELAKHAGGYSTFRVNLTGMLRPQNVLTVEVDNSSNRTVYPQKADFTFYGGIYRDVKLIIVPNSHFALDNMGAPGIKITPKVTNDLRSAEVTLETWVENTTDDTLVTIEIEGIGNSTVPVQNGKATACISIDNVRLWNGLEDPYLYTASARLPSGDCIKSHFGCRTIAFDANNGFYLNGKNIRLVGSARHQDRAGIGNALTKAEHDEDMAILCEMGANTVRLAHYQHAQYFYDLCDRHGLVAWAEIPYITEHMPEGRANSLSQMEELVMQCYNHPSIICWGLSNEISATGGVNEDMVENHKLLNDLCHKLDRTRPTAMAHVFMLDHNSDFVTLPDISSYNLYYGWYIGECEQNDAWFDTFHAAHPDTVIGLAEYGADANPAYQTAKPEKGDWTESYQAMYHEHMLKMWSERPFIWAMYCWNGFDFGADGRDEGGKPGQNQKGLVTFDRKIKKDAFYIYKAYMSKEPFVHLCGSRYVDRPEDETEIKVYSNMPEVTLLVDGNYREVQKADKIFTFTVPINGTHNIEARAGHYSDEITIRRVDKPNPEYAKDGGEIINWFDKPEALIREGYFSIMDSLESLKQNPEAALLLEQIQAKATASYGDVAKNIQMPEEIARQMDKMPLHSMLKQAGKAISPEMVKQLNAALNQIHK